jgi:hypothetical protein
MNNLNFLRECVNCHNKVLPTNDNLCPSCKKQIDALETKTQLPNTQVIFKKERIGCITFYLLTLMILGGLSIIYYLYVLLFQFNSYLQRMRIYYPSINEFTLILLILLSIPSFINIVALWKWKKWGFYGGLITITIVFILLLGSLRNILLVISMFIGGVIGFILFLIIINIGGAKSLWKQLD